MPKIRACETTLMSNDFIGALRALLDARITFPLCLPRPSLDTWKSKPLSSQPTFEPTASVSTDEATWFTPHVTEREVTHVLRESQAGPLAHQTVTRPDEEHVEHDAREN